MASENKPHSGESARVVVFGLASEHIKTNNKTVEAASWGPIFPQKFSWT